MSSVQTPPPKHSSALMAWLPWIALGAVIVTGVVVITEMDPDRGRASPEALAAHAAAIRAGGFDCPEATRILPQLQNRQGQVARVTCSSGTDFRVTWPRDDRGARAEPWHQP